MDFCLYISITYERNLLKITISVSGFSLFTLPFATCFRSFETMFLGIDIGFCRYEFCFCFCFVPNSIYLSYFTCIFVIFALSVIIDNLFCVYLCICFLFGPFNLYSFKKEKEKKTTSFLFFFGLIKIFYLFIYLLISINPISIPFHSFLD